MIRLGQGGGFFSYNKTEACGSGRSSFPLGRPFLGQQSLFAPTYQGCIEACANSYGWDMSDSQAKNCHDGCQQKYGTLPAQENSNPPVSTDPTPYVEGPQLDSKWYASQFVVNQPIPQKPNTPVPPGYKQTSQPTDDWKKTLLPLAVGAAGLFAVIAILGPATRVGAGTSTPGVPA